jgi:penicillin amidase
VGVLCVFVRRFRGTEYYNKAEGKATGVLAMSKSVAALLDNSPSSFVEVTAGVIAPKKTKNGKVIFANDPHIGFQPGTWYEAHSNS